MLHKFFNGKNLRLLGLWLMILIVICFIIASLIVPGDAIAFDNESEYDFNDGWELVDTSGQSGDKSSLITLPAKIQASGAVRIVKTVPYGITYPAVLSIRTAHQKVRLYCDNELIYSFGYDNMPMFGKSPGSAWNFVRLAKDVEGKKLMMEFESPYSTYKGKIGSITVGSKASLLFSLLRRYIFPLILTLIIFAAGIGTLVVYFFVIRKDNTIGKEMLYLGLFSIFVSLWLFGEGKLTQFFAIPPALNTYFTIIAMLATPIPLVKYVACGQNTFQYKMPDIVYKFLSLLLVGSVLLQAFEVVDFIEQLPFIHICFIISCIIMLYIVVFDAIKHRNNDKFWLMISLGIFALFFLLETLILYIIRSSVGGMMCIGVLLFIAIQARMAFKKASVIMQMSRLAGIDALTGCFNRTVYNQMIIELDGQDSIGVVIADINNLKIINDTYGHDAGDDAIIRCSKVFSKVFSSCGCCFRIGGDEFIMLGKNLTPQQLSIIGKSFSSLTKAENSKVTYPFAVSYGYAVFDSQYDESLSDTIRRADEVMYQNKRQFKQQNANS